MEEAEEDVLSYAAFPAEHWQKIWSNNPLERVNKEVKRRTNVVGIFPTEGSVDKACGCCALRTARRVASLKTLLQHRIVSEAGAKGGADRAAAVDGWVGSVEPCTSRFTLRGKSLDFGALTNIEASLDRTHTRYAGQIQVRGVTRTPFQTVS
jgi:hypothetical protein